MEAAFGRKQEKYTELTAECREAGWSAVNYCVEVVCRGFVGTSTQRFLRSVGVTDTKLKKELKELAKEAEQGSFWLWLRRKARILEAAAGGAVGRRPYRGSSTILRCSGINGATHIYEGWLPADDPAAVSMVPLEVRQAAIPYLCFHLNGGRICRCIVLLKSGSSTIQFSFS